MISGYMAIWTSLMELHGRDIPKSCECQTSGTSGIVGKKRCRPLTVWIQVTIVTPTHSRGDRSRVLNLCPGDGVSARATGSCTRGNENFSFSAHCRRTRVDREKKPRTRNPIRMLHQANGPSQGFHGSASPRWRPSKKAVTAVGSVTNSFDGRCEMIFGPH